MPTDLIQSTSMPRARSPERRIWLMNRNFNKARHGRYHPAMQSFFDRPQYWWNIAWILPAYALVWWTPTSINDDIDYQQDDLECKSWIAMPLNYAMMITTVTRWCTTRLSPWDHNFSRLRTCLRQPMISKSIRAVAQLSETSIPLTCTACAEQCLIELAYRAQG